MWGRTSFKGKGYYKKMSRSPVTWIKQLKDSWMDRWQQTPHIQVKGLSSYMKMNNIFKYEVNTPLGILFEPFCKYSKLISNGGCTIFVCTIKGMRVQVFNVPPLLVYIFCVSKSNGSIF
ncbi:unnamed protein product [Cuscuta europaea]|uniref:Uncharacterized protein n=1 Tax=Cuscuta europaea TaxID=41803 RepID=A0A9P0VSJ3_CUSEU|nr:unnamed protein product [Cuscuta europaea]